MTLDLAHNEAWHCALCEPPRVNVESKPVVPLISGAKARTDDLGMFWLPAQEYEYDEEIVGNLLSNWLFIADCFHCPVHEETWGSGMPARDFYQFAEAEESDEQYLIGRALLWLLREGRAYRFGAGKAGSPYRYYRRWWSCEKDASEPCKLVTPPEEQRAGRIASTAEIVPAVMKKVERRRKAKSEGDFVGFITGK